MMGNGFVSCEVLCCCLQSGVDMSEVIPWIDA